MSFNSMQLLKKYFGYSAFRGGQQKIIDSILSGRDTFAIMPTGAGKSICYQIPALMRDGVTLVISPLISLMKDQVDSLNTIGIPATFINSSLSAREVGIRMHRTYAGEYKLLYVAPERLESEEFIQLANSLAISLIAVDEAHCVSQWGHDFRPSYRSIAPFISKLTKRPIVSIFTATATAEVKEDIVSLLKLKNPNIFITGFDRENLSFSVIKGQNKTDFILNYLKSNPQDGIIYAATRKEVDNLYLLLKNKGYSVGKYHAGLSEAERTSVQEDFSYDRLNIMVATNAFGMGIDKSNVRFVIHYNMPKNMEAYYQEAGRAGRDGEKSDCILLFSAQDIFLQKYLIEQTTLDPERKANEYHKLQIMSDYCHTPRCLRKYILEYFGEKDLPDNCGNCSNCNDDSELCDITIAAQKIFSCILRIKERYGITVIADILKGANNKKIRELAFNKLSTYGLLKNLPLQSIKDLINLLIAEDYLALTEGAYPVVRLGAKAVDVLHGKASVMQKIPAAPAQNNIASDLDQVLFDKLRQLRRQFAVEENVPPFVIFADSTLKELAKHKPTTLKDMLNIKGVGEVKLKRYGAAFIEAIADYLPAATKSPVTIDPLPEPSPLKDKTPSHLITLEMHHAGCSLTDIATERNLKLQTLQEHLLRCNQEGISINWDALIPSAEYETLILEKAKQLNTTKLKPIKEALPDIDYMTIRAVLTKYKLM